MKSRYSLVIAGLLLTFVSIAQPIGYYNDALLFSQTTPFGSSARIQSLGGAQVALGGDISHAGSNPAGLGFYNKSVFSFTPSVNFHDTEGIYNGNLVRSYQPNLNLPNMGVVLNHTIGDIPANKFKGGSFAISVTRINDFNQKFAYEGYSNNSSIVDSFLDNAGNTPIDDLPGSEYGAYYTYLIDPQFDNNNKVTGYETYAGYEPYQSERVTTSGGQNQLNFSWGGNYDDKIYFGAGLGIQTLHYERRRYYTESEFIDDQNNNFLSSLSIKDQLTIDGTGLNGSFGMIIRPVHFMTMGLSYTTPTFFALKDEAGFTTTANWNNFQYDDETLLNQETYVSDLTTSEYNLRTPGRLNLGTAIFIGKRGFITGDVEFVDHADALLQSNTVEFDMNEDNQAIQNLYKSTVNVKLGAEIRLEEFRFRAGYAYFEDPYRNPVYDRSRSNLTFGAGFRQKDFFVDLAVVTSNSSQYYSPYEMNDVTNQPLVEVNNNNTSVSATFGLNF